MSGLDRRPRRARRAPEPDAARDAETGADTDPAADPESAARTVCLDLLTTRARSRAELAEALARRGCPDEVVATVLDRLVEVGLVDDTAFAEQWVSSRHRVRGLGRRALSQELRNKGVDRETATEALEALGRDDERVRARELVDRRLASLGRLDDTTAARRLVGMLARKGYDGGIAHGVVREAMATRGDGLPDTDLDTELSDGLPGPG